jgi:hypothetical protein
MLEFHSRCFTDIANVHTKISYEFGSTTYYAAGKLAFNLLTILLSEIQARGGSTVWHELTALLRSHPPFYLVKNDPLELEKVKAMLAVEEFLKV